jgi:gamma-glutamyltranspeptidase/glutathione hydrolase
MAATYRRIAEAGADDFYEGEIAGKIVADMEENGGLISATDLKNAGPRRH